MAGSSFNHYKKRGSRRTFRPNTEINITPLVDVMLVLVVIFMVTAPMMTVGISVDLPKTNAAPKSVESQDPVIVSLNSEGKIFLQETEMQFEELISRLRVITNSNPEAKIYVRGDQKLAYRQIIKVMGAISESGFSKVSLIAELAK